MTSKTFSHKLVASLTAAAILSVYSTFTFATTGLRGAELSVFGEVALNGQRAISGVTIFSECSIVTAEGSSASVSLGKLGRIDLLANTNLKLSFAEHNMAATLVSGQAHFKTPVGVALTLTTRDGSVKIDGSQATSFNVHTENDNTVLVTEYGFVEVRSGAVTTKTAANRIETAGNMQGTAKDDSESHRGSFWVAWLATGSVIAAAVWVVTHERPPHQDLDFGGTIANPSPS